MYTKKCNTLNEKERKKKNLARGKNRNVVIADEVGSSRIREDANSGSTL